MKPITKDNWKDCIALKVQQDQQSFLPDNLYSIAEAQFYPDAQALAIYNQSNQMVGFLLYGRDDKTLKWKIFRLMIDQKHQHKGYGRATIQKVVELISQKDDGDQIIICYHDANEAARKLYGDLGFLEVAIDDGVATAILS